MLQFLTYFSKDGHVFRLIIEFIENWKKFKRFVLRQMVSEIIVSFIGLRDDCAENVGGERDNVLQQQVRQVLDLDAELHASNNLDL